MREPKHIAVFRSAFSEAGATEGVSVKVQGDGPTVQAVNVMAVRAAFARRYITGEADESKRKATVRQAFGRALKNLPLDLVSGAWDGIEWIWELK